MPKDDSKISAVTKQIETNQTSTYHSDSQQKFEDDTIDLYEIWLTLLKNKWLIIAITLVAALGSIVYVLQLQRIYKAEALLLPPKVKDIQSLNILEFLSKDKETETNNTETLITADSAFKKFMQNLESRTLQKKFIQENNLMLILSPDRTDENADLGIYDRFSELVNIEKTKGKTSLSIELHDREIVAQWVNDLIEFINKETLNMMVDDIQDSIAIKARDINYKIASRRQMGKQRRLDNIERFEEAAMIAQKLGVRDRVDSTNIVQNNQLNITTTNIPLYFRGYKALNTEIIALKKRTSDDPYIKGLRDLQEELALLSSIKFDKEKMSSVHIDQGASVPTNPIKPNRRFIVSLVTAIGLFSGIFLAFFFEFVRNLKKKHSN